MEKETLLGLSITEDEWLIQHGALPYHRGRDYARMPRRIARTATTLRVSPHGSRSTNTTPAGPRSSGPDRQRPSSRLKENLNAANQSHSKFSGQMNTLEKGTGRLSYPSSLPWHQVPASHPPAPGPLPSIFQGIQTNWVPASHPPALGPSSSILQGIPPNWVSDSHPPAPGPLPSIFPGVPPDWQPLTQSQLMTHSDNYSSWRSLPNWQ
ncbi:hypothetical protein FIBSPDRAFT_51943 [Athelia psychrophila]|uniref:Uncharacterized protein n=1 Tax=Athelia psychrophila TaxID=1759441 RepID=A0A166FHC2_9AGAM|nr:hypothetical protein FIBSPDRAFT_51943 [Fibularhizoctonia sp. CBS 109695]